jgi:putative sterol carrier protein
MDKDLKADIQEKIEGQSLSPEDLRDYRRLFIQICNESENIREEVEGWSIRIHFAAVGTGGAYYQIDENGNFSGETGEPPKPSDLTLQLKPEIIVDILLGKLDTHSAYITKKIQLKGKLTDAVKFRKIWEMGHEKILE